ncbi:cytochrome b/b6 domain-containing protein [Cereibacter sphaeroides]|nr:cytochrome b/b6 domain-containing protein [Cereibacter sphaeroides]
MSTKPVRVWDPLVRLFHWSLVLTFAANALIIDPESALHHWVGYTVLGLVLFRLLWGFVGTRYARFSSFPPSPRAAMGQLTDMATGRNRVHVGHTPLGAFMIYNLLAALLALAGTGWMLTTDAYWGVAWVKEVHELLVHWVEVSVVAHIAAVLWESRRTGVNLPQAMISGVKTLPVEGMTGE